MTRKIEEIVQIAPSVWPEQTLEVQPGDMSRFVPMGMGLGAPMIMLPWDNLQSVASRGNYYQFHPHSGHPISGAPETEPAGGVVYFDDGCAREDIDALLRIMGVRSWVSDYAVFRQDATSPEDRFLTQMRIIGGSALRPLFGIQESPESKQFRQQPLEIGQGQRI
ncbi:MAG TPA: hypothetical protein PKD64_18530 [Pirellulaceae bacterium]|nr:hypothetical protein [Pirellulaceae bacterium]HMO94187.1 hypothetical protein [Pirellulaceae bacterium]HMP71192.1 hypothetical protein [Pirellulaceae bacterium]